jgi:hypothetical protein
VVEGAPTRTNHYCANNYWFWDGTTLKRTAGDGFFIHSLWGASEEWVSKAVKLSDLKRLVESVDYVAIHGYEKSKEILKNAPVGAECYSWSLGNSGVRDKTVELVKLKQAIADYEAIYSEQVK